MDDHPTTRLPSRDVARAKSTLRVKARAARRAVCPELRAAHAEALARRALALPELATANAVMVYGATPEEIDVSALERALRRRGARIAYPRVRGDQELSLHWVEDASDLVPGSFDLREPAVDAPEAAITDLSAIIVPGVAFDPFGNRLGFGAGYYDALLASRKGRPVAVGVAYDEQIVETVPHDAKDHPVDIVLTPTRTFRRA